MLTTVPFWVFFMVISKNIDSDFLLQTVSSAGTGTDQNFIIGCCYFLKSLSYWYEPKLYYLLPVFFLLSFCFLVTLLSYVSVLPIES